MVNSGSSANLLAVAAIANKLRPVHCDAGDEVLVPSVCWSTSVHPLLQVRHVGCCPLRVLCSVHFVFLAVDIGVS
jgi:CDP-6-deoxy-D-xylo-4-hexulose-3-dehydrase